MLVNKMQNNILSLLVHHKKLSKPNTKYFYKKCDIPSCKTCHFSNPYYYIQLSNNFILPIRTHSSCNSKFAIYILHCKLCSAFYIGQTKCIKDRIYTHVNNIKKFVPYELNNTCVSIHFNQKPHNFNLHFSFYVFTTYVEDDLDARLNNESFIINLFKYCGNTIINDYTPPIKSFFFIHN